MRRGLLPIAMLIVIVVAVIYLSGPAEPPILSGHGIAYVAIIGAAFVLSIRGARRRR